ncbi:right-handed parallel beta-helix repeat-containing protein [Candidatus Sumerlaeota bacterium]|nr:right-handed parallel beta-helix repeat-containing protein [Candidatus Sumerlaeota bacterium]
MLKLFFSLIILRLSLFATGDSYLSLGESGYAILEDGKTQDLDYSKGFSVEGAIYIKRNASGGRWPYIIAKAGNYGSFRSDVPGFSLGINQGHLSRYGQKIVAKVGDGISDVTISSKECEGYAYAVMTWEPTSGTLVLYLNGMEQGNENSAGIASALIANPAPLGIGNSGGYLPLGRDIILARLWNRVLIRSEIEILWDRFDQTKRHILPEGIDHTGLHSEWLMDHALTDKDQPSITFLKDNVGSNSLELKDGAKLVSGLGSFKLIEPSDGAINIDKSVFLTVEGGYYDLGASITLPLRYRFQIDETPDFDSPFLMDSGWRAHYNQRSFDLKPLTKYFWRAKVGDSSNTPHESVYSEARSFTTEDSSVWFVRPRNNQCAYGNEDGTSYENAFNGLSNWDPARGMFPGIIWGSGGVEAGDTLYICDAHILEIPDHIFYSEYGAIYITASGHSEDYPIVIRSDHPDYPGIVWGFAKDRYYSDTWRGPDENNVYNTERDLGAPLAEIGPDKFTGTVYVDDTGTTTWENHYGAFHRDKDNGITYIKTSDGSAPEDKIHTRNYGYSFKIERQKHIVFKNLVVKGANFFREEIDGDGKDVTITNEPRSTYITFDSCELKYGSGEKPFMQLFTGHDHWIFRNNAIMYFGNAVYTLGRSGAGANHLIVENNVIKHIGTPVFWTTQTGPDGHAVGIQEGQGHIIQGNYIENTGSAIEFWCGEDPMRDMIVRYNFIKDTHIFKTMGGGITISGTHTDSQGKRTGFQIYHNIVVNAEGAGISSNNKDTVEIYNNDLYNCGIGIRIAVLNALPSVHIYNNMVVDPLNYYIFMVGSVESSWDNAHLDNNLYDPKANEGEQFYTSLTGYGDFMDYKSQTGFESETIIGDPLFIVDHPTTPGHFTLQEDSPAIDAGFDVGMKRDFFGAPITGVPDIGAFEYPDMAFLAGDLNKDGVVDFTDMQACAWHILGKQILGKQADVNNDGLIDIADVIDIANIISEARQ